jgi:HupE / UreJ protein
MNEFWIYFQLGLKHVLDINGYDHVLFITALATPFIIKDWRKVIILASLFTLGHTISLFLSVYQLVVFNINLIELLIPITILITAMYHLFFSIKSKKNNHFIEIILTLFFGLIHGFGFSNYFKSILPGDNEAKLFPLIEFALGIEAAQIIVVLVVLAIASTLQNFFKVSKKDWILVVSSIIVGILIPMLLERV